MKKAMAGLLEPTLKEVRIGAAEVRDIFKTPKFGTIAGCMVTEGRITRSGDTQARLMRDGVVVYEGKIGSLRRFKDDVSRGQGRLRMRHRLREVQRHQGRATSSRSFVVERVAARCRRRAGQVSHRMPFQSNHGSRLPTRTRR